MITQARLVNEKYLLQNRKELLLGSNFDREMFPNLYNLSSAFTHNIIPVPRDKKLPEFVFLKNYYKDQRSAELEVAISDWNMLWEVGHLRAEFLGDDLPKELEWLRNYQDANIYLVPETVDYPYQTYLPLFHLLPYWTRKRFGLPLIYKGNWPFTIDFQRYLIEDLLGKSFVANLSKAFAFHIWPLLDNQNRLTAFSKNESISLLAHNLKFWLPHLYTVIEEGMAEFGRVEPESEDIIKNIKKLQKQNPDIDIKLPLKGGYIWRGEDEAWRYSRKLVEKADEAGQLRGMIDAIKSNRVKDDFSDKWSFEKEDFERKVFSKRNKIKVNFVEISESVPMHSSTSQIEDNMLWDDLISLVDKKERRVVVCLQKGITKHQEISDFLGYRNHSPITKSLQIIRNKAMKELGIKPIKGKSKD